MSADRLYKLCMATEELISFALKWHIDFTFLEKMVIKDISTSNRQQLKEYISKYNMLDFSKNISRNLKIYYWVELWRVSPLGFKISAISQFKQQFSNSL